MSARWIDIVGDVLDEDVGVGGVDVCGGKKLFVSGGFEGQMTRQSTSLNRRSFSSPLEGQRCEPSSYQNANAEQVRHAPSQARLHLRVNLPFHRIVSTI